MKIYQDKISNYKNNDLSFWLIIILLASMMFSLFILQAALIILLIAYLYKSIKDKKFYYFKTPIDNAFLVFIAVRVLSIIFSTNISLSLPSLNKEIIFYSTFFLFTHFLNQDEENNFVLMIKILILSGTVASLYGTSKVLLGIVDRAESSTSGYSTLGMFLTVIYSITISLGKNKKYFSSRYLWFAVLIILLTGILFTYNRTHWGIVGIIILFVAVTRERILLIVPIVFAAIIILFVPSLSERFVQLIHFDQNLSDRDIIWKGAYQLMFDHPFTGFGTRTFKEIFPLFDQMQDKGVASWHSDYLQMYFESGLIGLTAFLLLMFTIYKNGIRIIKNKITSELSPDILLAVLLGLSAFYLTAFVGGFILDPINSILFQFLTAIVGVISAKAIKENITINKID